ncbi:MAG: hypothetical protein EU531_03045 [Promethearchaeota archaeon]|nr:MAG: hypothetical protein EU531_03045 [Candidatus Lokiarchaeota archaeon]
MEIQLSLRKNKYSRQIVAIILSAGKGTRIKDTFPSTPKSLIKIHTLNDVSIIDHLISLLLDLETDRIEVIIGHLGYQIEKHIALLKSNAKKGYDRVSIRDSGQEYQKGAFFSFMSFAKDLSRYSSKDLFLILPGDTIFSKGLIKNIFLLISQHDSLFRDYPSIFYQDRKREDLELAPPHSVSILETFTEKKEICLKKITQIDSSNQNLVKVKQMVPIVCFPYKFIMKIVNKANIMHINSIRNMINFLVESEGQKFFVYELNSEHRFYDIDSEIDLSNFEKKGGQ